eukprot:2425509-Alexandrium_andersonii.AAC.1
MTGPPGSNWGASESGIRSARAQRLRNVVLLSFGQNSRTGMAGLPCLNWGASESGVRSARAQELQSVGAALPPVWSAEPPGLDTELPSFDCGTSGLCLQNPPSLASEDLELQSAEFSASSADSRAWIAPPPGFSCGTSERYPGSRR